MSANGDTIEHARDTKDKKFGSGFQGAFSQAGKEIKGSLIMYIWVQGPVGLQVTAERMLRTILQQKGDLKEDRQTGGMGQQEGPDNSMCK